MMRLQTIFLVAYLAMIYNYTVDFGDNDTIIMHYDEPISELEKEWEEMEEEDEKEHAEEAKEWYKDDKDDKDDDKKDD